MVLTRYPGLLTASASPNVKGVYTQLVAATPAASSRLHVHVTSATVARRFFLIDLATGAAAAETVVVSNLAVDADADALISTALAIDVDLPAGTRLAARCQAFTASSAVNLVVWLEDRPLGGLATPVTYGAVTGSSRGTTIDCGAVANTKTAYTEFAASTATRIDALSLWTTQGSQGLSIAAFTTFTLDVAVGAAGLETIVLADVPAIANLNGDHVRPGVQAFPVAIPAGSRIAVRAACSVGTAADRIVAVTLTGMQEPASGGGSAAGAVAYVG